MYYGSYRAPRTLVWAIGTVLFIAMVGTGFLGYLNSPKWFNIKVDKNKNNRVSSLSTARYYSTKSNLPSLSVWKITWPNKWIKFKSCLYFRKSNIRKY